MASLILGVHVVLEPPLPLFTGNFPQARHKRHFNAYILGKFSGGKGTAKLIANK
jgi:hypothetical protein